MERTFTYYRLLVFFPQEEVMKDLQVLSSPVSLLEDNKDTRMDLDRVYMDCSHTVSSH
jgi:hypothetical protein